MHDKAVEEKSEKALDDNKNQNKEERIIWLHQKRIDTQNTHGTGCTFSAAVAAFLARSFPLLQAVKKAKQYITGALEASCQLSIGAGHGPVHHFYQTW